MSIARGPPRSFFLPGAWEHTVYATLLSFFAVRFIPAYSLVWRWASSCILCFTWAPITHLSWTPSLCLMFGTCGAFTTPLASDALSPHSPGFTRSRPSGHPSRASSSGIAATGRAATETMGIVEGTRRCDGKRRCNDDETRILTKTRIVYHLLTTLSYGDAATASAIVTYDIPSSGLHAPHWRAHP